MIEVKDISKLFYILGSLLILVLTILSIFSLIYNINIVANILGGTEYFVLELILVIFGWLKALLFNLLIGFAIIGGAEIISLLFVQKKNNKISAL